MRDDAPSSDRGGVGDLAGARSESVQRERGVRMQARPAFDEAFPSDGSDMAHLEPPHNCPRGVIVNLRVRDDWHVRLVPGGPTERRPAELGRIAATGAVVADCPAEFEHRLAVEVDASKAPRARRVTRRNDREPSTFQPRPPAIVPPCWRPTPPLPQASRGRSREQPGERRRARPGPRCP